MKLEPCPKCGGTDIRYNPIDAAHYCWDCNTWPSRQRIQEVAVREWNEYAKKVAT